MRDTREVTQSNGRKPGNVANGGCKPTRRKETKMRRYTKMDKMILLIHYLDSDATDLQKVNEIRLFRDDGVITDEEGVDLVLAYNLHI